MNLVVVRPDGTVYARPDTTLVRGARDFYLPDDFSFVDVRPCRWIRILKSAKAVQERFASRYYDAVGSGLLLYGDGTDPLLDASTYIFDPTAPNGSGYPLGGTAVGESPALPDTVSPCTAPNGSEHPAVGTIAGKSSSLPDGSSPFSAALANVTRHLLLHQGDLLILESPESTTLRRGDAHPAASFRIL